LIISFEKSILGLFFAIRYASPAPRFNEFKKRRFMLVVSLIKIAGNGLGLADVPAFTALRFG
jgi:hypothetical protein